MARRIIHWYIVTFQMDDNGYSRQNVNDNIPNIQRSFAVQMRCD